MKKICVITGSRAEYGILYWILKELQQDSQIDLQLVVTGMHLNPKFGETWKVIKNDGFTINAKADLGNQDDSSASIASQIANGVLTISDALSRLCPDIALILGDRYEMLAAAQAALITQTPLAHVHGGELTEGAIDDSIRHAITKMAQLHFTASEQYRKRVIQLGENPQTVHNVGAPGLENFNRLDLLSKTDLEHELNFKLLEKNLLITYHPVTLDDEQEITPLIEALKEFNQCGKIITMPNSDVGHSKIFHHWENFKKSHPHVYLATSLGQIRYLSAMKTCNVVIGNSSSGMIEAPFCGTPTVDIGTRQKGRLKSKSVFHVENDSARITEAIELAMKQTFSPSSLLGDGQASKKIVNILKNYNNKGTAKEFYNLDFR